MVLKLAGQYDGALEGWKDATNRNQILVNEKTADEPQVLKLTGQMVSIPSDCGVVYQSPESVQLEIEKGMLAKLVSPLRKAWLAEGGKAQDFPPIQLTASFIEQVDALLGGKVDEYVQPDPCPVCQNHTWVIESGKKICLFCEQGKAKRKAQFQGEILKKKQDKLMQLADYFVDFLPRDSKAGKLALELQSLVNENERQ
jgi:hypothetical protein